MSQKTQPGLSVGCIAETSKAVLPRALCDLFVQEMATRFPGRDIAAAATDTQPDVVLVVEASSPNRFSAHIDHDGQTGPSLATARKGAPLDDAALADLLRGLIEATPNL